MNEQFGTQGGFGDILGASASFSDGANIFKSAIGKFTFGILSLKKVVDSGKLEGWGGTTLKLTGVLENFTDVFSKAKLVDVIADLSKNLYSTRKELERTYGLFGGSRNEVTNALMEQSKASIEYGIGIQQNTEAFKAIATELGSLSFDVGLTSMTAKISKAFNIGAESTAKIVTSLSRFGRKDPDGINKFFEDINKQSYEAGVSHELVAENMAASSKSMYRFRLDTAKGEQKFKKMAIHATKMGVGIDQMVEAMDKYRTIPGALEGSVTASLAGLNISSQKLLASARGGDPSAIFDTVLSYLGKYTNVTTGALEGVGIDLADQLGPMINMDRDQINRSLMRMRESGDSSDKFYVSWQERMKRQQTISEKIENVLYGVLDATWIIVNPILNILEGITKHTKITTILLGVTAAMFTYMKNKEYLKGAYAAGLSGRGKKGGFLGGITDFIRGGQPSSGGGGTGMGGGGGSPSGGGSKQLTFNQQQNMMKSQTKFMGAQAKSMALSAIPMLAFAGAMIMLSVAFKKFGEVEWKKAWGGIVVMGAFTGAMLLLGSAVTAGAPALLALGGLMLAFSLSTIAMAQALNMVVEPLQSLKDMGLVSLGAGLLALSAGMIGMMAIGTTGFLGGLALGAGVLMSVKVIEAIGKSASKHANNIETLSYSMMRLAEAMERLNAVKSANVNLDINKSAVNKLENASLILAKNTSESRREKIDNTITIELDGVKLARELVKTIGIRSAA